MLSLNKKFKIIFRMYNMLGLIEGSLLKYFQIIVFKALKEISLFVSHLDKLFKLLLNHRVLILSVSNSGKLLIRLN